MADASKLPNLTEMTYFQWALPTAANPRLAAPISATATTITFTNPPLDKDGNVVATAFMMGIRQKNGYVENVLVPAGAMSVDGLTATGVTRGIELEGIDYTTGDSSLAVSHNADEPVYCNISGVMHAITVAALQGDIATGGTDFRFGDETDVDITIYAANGDANEPFFRYDSATNQFVYSNDGVSSTPFGTGAGVTGGDGITVTAGDIDIDVTDNTIFEGTSGHDDDVAREDFESYANSAALQAAWSTTTGDANAPTLTYDEYKDGTKGMQATATFAAGSGTWRATALANVDASAITGVASGAPTKGGIGFWMKVNDFTKLTRVRISLGTDNTNQAIAEDTIPTDNEWNYYIFPLSTAVINGTPNWSTTNVFISVAVELTADITCYFDSFAFVSYEDDEDKVVTLDAEGKIPGGFLARATEDEAGAVQMASDDDIKLGSPYSDLGRTLAVPSDSAYARGQLSAIRAKAGEALNDDKPVYCSDGTGGKTAGRFYTSDANNTTDEAMKFSGFIEDSQSSIGGGITVRRGLVDGLTGLTAGIYYYLDTTTGNLTATPPAAGARVCVGRAISSTTLDTYDREQFQMGMYFPTFNLPAAPASTADTTITTYFKPTHFRVEGVLQISASTIAQSTGWALYNIADGDVTACAYQNGDTTANPTFNSIGLDVLDPVLIALPSTGANRSQLQFQFGSSDNTSLTLTLNNVISQGTGATTGQLCQLGVTVWGYTV